MITKSVANWRLLLAVIAGVNVVAWCQSAAAVWHAGAIARVGASGATLQLILSAAYVSGCAYRCLWPVYDIPRRAVVDSPLSSVAIGRSVATVAELCFAAQWALVLHELALPGDNPLALFTSLAILPLIAVAELCSWHAVLTTAQRGHIAENSLWTLTAILIVATLLTAGPARLMTRYPPALAWCMGGAAYIAFMVCYDVPMYWRRWRADQARGRRYQSMAQGLAEVRRRCTVSRRWEDWKSEVGWMTLYFSCGVWSSISLVYAALALAR